jgi:hypothetical protein
MQRIPSGFSTIRDILLFIIGVLGVFHETVVTTTDRPTLLILFAAILGTPLFLKNGDKEA